VAYAGADDLPFLVERFRERSANVRQLHLATCASQAYYLAAVKFSMVLTLLCATRVRLADRVVSAFALTPP
jgi:hypothetical protein